MTSAVDTLDTWRRLESRLMQLIAAIEQVRTTDELEDASDTARIYLEILGEQGYHVVGIEGFQARIRKATAQASVTLRAAQAGDPNQKSPTGLTDKGLDVIYFRDRFKAVLATMRAYTPAELARECARMARLADARVLSEDEFQ